jgi:carbamoyltransferase
VTGPDIGRKGPTPDPLSTTARLVGFVFLACPVLRVTAAAISDHDSANRAKPTETPLRSNGTGKAALSSTRTPALYVIILGLHRDPWHSTGAAMIRADADGPRFVMVSEERLDRTKDSRAFPLGAIAACMAGLGVTSERDIDLVVLDYIRYPDWRRDQYRVPAVQGTLLENIDPRRIHVINHHLAHAAAVFFSSTMPDAAILIVDGRGSDNETQSLFVGEGTTIRRIVRTDRIGIGLLYAAVTQAIGFGLLQEGKTMGLAPYGADVPGPILEFNGAYDGIVTDYSEICIEGSYSLRRPIELNTFPEKARAAYDVQVECERALMHLAGFAHAKTAKSRLCLSGGVALNSVANFLIAKQTMFDQVFINPAASDTGIPLGAALYGYHVIAGNERLSHPISPFIGPCYPAAAIEEAIALAAQSCRIEQTNVVASCADLLASNRIVGHFHGRSEMGPRALGNRSILMSPLKGENKDILNARVKHREAFRPFAPACLAERASEFFEIDFPSAYMLFVPPVRPHKRAIIPAVTHYDGSGRLQTVSQTDNPRFHQLITLFNERTGVPVLLNTSFNDNGEPIVETPADAVRCFLVTEIDALLLEDTLLVKNR